MCMNMRVQFTQIEQIESKLTVHDVLGFWGFGKTGSPYFPLFPASHACRATGSQQNLFVILMGKCVSMLRLLADFGQSIEDKPSTRDRR